MCAVEFEGNVLDVLQYSLVCFYGWFMDLEVVVLSTLHCFSVASAFLGKPSFVFNPLLGHLIFKVNIILLYIHSLGVFGLYGNTLTGY